MMPSITRPERRFSSLKLLAILFWLAVWQLAALAVGQEFLLASPIKVLASLLKLLADGVTYRAALLSSLRVLLGFLAGYVFALLLAAGSSSSAVIRALASPLVALARSVPVASFVILAIILVSSRWLSTLIAFVIGFPVVYANVLEGLAARDRQLAEMAGLFQVPLPRRLVFLTLPQLAPYLRAGGVTALGLCWKSGIAAEVIGIPRGSIGERLYMVKVNYLTADLFAWTAIIICLSILSAALLKRLLNLAFNRLERL